MTKKERIMKYKQKKLNQRFAWFIIANVLIILAIMFVAIVSSIEVSGNNEIEDESKFMVYESVEMDDHYTVTSSANASFETTAPVEAELIETFSRNLTEEDKYMLAKIAMAEAEGENFETKVLVILTILNRVESDSFPDTIEDVIFESHEGVYQFSPVMPEGRWWTTEPNDECWNAVNAVNEMKEDISEGALFFEACSGESWHSQNLEFICQSDNTRFYK